MLACPGGERRGLLLLLFLRVICFRAGENHKHTLTGLTFIRRRSILLCLQLTNACVKLAKPAVSNGLFLIVTILIACNRLANSATILAAVAESTSFTLAVAKLRVVIAKLGLFVASICARKFRRCRPLASQLLENYFSSFPSSLRDDCGDCLLVHCSRRR